MTRRRHGTTAQEGVGGKFILREMGGGGRTGPGDERWGEGPGMRDEKAK